MKEKGLPGDYDRLRQELLPYLAFSGTDSFAKAYFLKAAHGTCYRKIGIVETRRQYHNKCKPTEYPKHNRRHVRTYGDHGATEILSDHDVI